MAEVSPYPGNPRYLVSTDGRVWGPSGKEIRGSVNKRWGHRNIRVYGGSRTAKRYRGVHQMVLETFVGACPPGMVCCHNNGQASDNRLSNLRWDTSSSNTRDLLHHGNHHNARKTHCKNGHEFTPDNTRVELAHLRADGTVGTGRVCKTCRRRRRRISNAASGALGSGIINP